MARWTFITILGFSLVAGLTATAQTLRVDVLLREVITTVTDSDGRLVTDLHPEDFIVELDGTPQKIEHFTHGKNVPLSIGLVLDTSRSMENTMTALKAAAESFVSGMHPEDESFIVTFDFKATLLQGFTHDPERLFNALQTVAAGGSTGLIRGITKARKNMAQAENPKRVLIVISDGGDSFSDEREVAGFQEQLDGIDVLIYPVQFQDLDETNTITKLAGHSRLTTDNLHGTPAGFRPDLAKRLMASIASESAGKYFYIKMTSLPNLLSRQLNDTFENIFTELRGQYSIGFYPGSDETASSRVRVRTLNPAYHVRTSAPHARPAAEADADPYETALLRADAEKRRGQGADAIRTLEHATILNSSDQRAFRALAQLYADQGRFTQALEVLNNLQSLGMLSGADHLIFGNVLLQLGDTSDAQVHFLQSLHQAPENPQVYFQLYKVYMNLNQPANALAILDQYLDRFPEDAGRDYAVERANKLR
jgi:VWFA-related protein